MLDELLYSIVRRPYVFVFLIVYLLIAVSHIGLNRTLVWTVTGWIVAFVCEASSIRNGFPFGLYHYREEAMKGELLIAGVPFWDSLSFTFLSYFSWTTSMLFWGPVYRRKDFQRMETNDLRRSPAVILTAAWLMTMLDVVIDPLTHQGDKWFLGNIYYYPNGGQHFDVPITNYMGWFFVATSIMFAYSLIERYLMTPAQGNETGIRWVPFGGLLGPLVFTGVIVFNLIVTYLIGDLTLFWAGVFIWGTPFILFLIKITLPESCASRSQIAASLDSFPLSPVNKRLFPSGPYSDADTSKN